MESYRKFYFILTILIVFMFSIVPSFAGENLAYNPTGQGFPHPLESDPGWGGGSYPWELLDGDRRCHLRGNWDCGWAPTGGELSFIEPCGWRQAIINFGQPTTFNRVVLSHNRLQDVTITYKIQYWDGENWIDAFSTTSGHDYLISTEGEILTEQGILLPGGYHKRPDRIIIYPNSVEVVDFKTGLPREGYLFQIKEYMILVKDMLRLPVKGYLCYLDNALIEEIDL